MKRITLFARSSNHRRLDEQLERCRRAAVERGLPLEGAVVIKDRCARAAIPVAQRPAYDRLLASIRHGGHHVVVVNELIVLTSDFEELAELLTIVRSGRLRLVTVDGLDTERPALS